MTHRRESRHKLWRLHTKTAVEAGIPVLFVEGRVSHAESAELEAAVGQHPPDGAGNVVIDLSGVDYISSAALKVFQALAERQVEKGGRLRLRAPSVAARLALELAGLLALVESE